MSDDGLSDYFDEPSMEIQIRTLMGTSFDMKVSSTDTIGDIKRKIYRVEGIPIYQQNLIFQSKELKDTNRLCDAGIRNGSQISLVTSMRGGPISTRRLAVACDHHVVLKELKELLENTREEIGEKLSPGSKVSVLVFKEGDIINLLRVIENEDGSYSPYSEKPLSPPAKPPRRSEQRFLSGILDKVVEDEDMAAKIAKLRKHMEDVSIRKQSRHNPKVATNSEEKLSDEASDVPKESLLAFKFLTEPPASVLDDVDVTIFEENFDEENNSEPEEIALKDKHRTKARPLKHRKSLYSENKGEYSHTRQNYARMHKMTRDLRAVESSSRDRKPEPLPAIKKKDGEAFDEDDVQLQPYSESLTVSARNRLHLTRLVLSDSTERPKSSPDSIELEENAQDLWEIHEPASERLKHSATCKVGLLKRRQSLDYGFSEGLDNTGNVKNEINYCKDSEFEVCSGYNYHMPQFVSSPSAIPPQYAPKDQGLCDYYFSNRSPLYGRKTKEETQEFKNTPTTLPEIKNEKFNFLSDCSSIQRLKNEDFSESLFSTGEEIDSLYGYYNLGCSSELLNEKSLEKKELIKLPPVMKKKARCSKCNKRLNITNIYNCRCGKIFCSQHRYSEVHQCSYDYKTEGRRILEQQNPLVTAEKVNRI